jgi:chromosome segregation ATPase
MQKELREMSKETTQEASSVYAKQLHYDRQIADLNVTISKLQSSLREAERNPSSEYMRKSSFNADDGDMANQVKTLSEEVLRLREKVASFNSESLTMKNRLKSAMDRAGKAEDHLAEARTASASNDDFDSMERGPTGNGMSRRRKGGGNKSVGSIRSTFRLEPGQGEGREHLGKVVDVVDSFAVTTGRSCRNGSSIIQLCSRV